MRAVNLELKGILQGVGFRPFVCNLARKHGIRGWVRNNGAGAQDLAEAEDRLLDRFVHELQISAFPPPAWRP